MKYTTEYFIKTTLPFCSLRSTLSKENQGRYRTQHGASGTVGAPEARQTLRTTCGRFQNA